mmetsp:Transcript_46247/g.112940  ORF Transcript_46247/g.112940 Transcript_46247/m.112940 type:complete len:279 (+) Transcript_46247:128-964(+)|eukprot:CAMPEP_0113458784 /NCGR_PEP_ID=MMETSP0014_2-20120614/10101_1 /TAXON_ID=2857 /ORGANISM="Nitzschia sp." /LENGTH=278 /DNA_ID=CAMNT_0000350319 /DNA_START=89 /DNA_END=925 /DNA_ORIENTATION=+ /assembly_acc=CAM_ASM_000159
MMKLLFSSSSAMIILAVVTAVAAVAATTGSSVVSAFQVRSTASASKARPSSSSTQKTATTQLDMSSFHLNSDPDSLSENRNNEPILQVLQTLEGPSICYGHFAAVEHKRELDIKEYDNFDRFRSLLDQVGDCSKILRGNGPFTVFVPTNSAFDKYDGVIDEEVIKTHIVAQDLYSDELDGTFETLSGHSVVCKKQFRKTYVDEALIGQLDNHTGGTPYPTNVICENGVLHAINTVLKPGWTRAPADSQGVQGLALSSHLNQDVLKDRGALPDSATSQH